MISLETDTLIYQVYLKCSIPAVENQIRWVYFTKAMDLLDQILKILKKVTSLFIC